MPFRIVTTALCAIALSLAQTKDQPDNQPFPPYKIMGNLYYVGANDITSYLVTTPAGHIIINPGYVETVPIIRDGVQKLGFKMSDVKIILNGQAHSDHIAGQKALQDLTGAKILAMDQDAGVIEGGGKGDFRWEGISSYPPVHVDRRLHDGEAIKLGGTTLIAHLTPGHTKGCTTYTMDVQEGGKKYSVVIVGGTSINPGVVLTNNPKYPEIASDYARTWRVLRALKCDIFLGAHGGYYGMIEKYEKMKAGAQPNPFIDPEGYQRHIDKAEKIYKDQLELEKSGRT